MASPPPPTAPPYSLRGRLLRLLLIAVALAALMQGAIGYYAAIHEADEIFDYHMQQIALAMRGSSRSSAQRVEHTGEDPNFNFVIQVWASDGAPVLASTPQA